jgi:hypothetical protein
MDTPKKDSKIRAIRRDVVIDNANPEPIPELVKETKWLYDMASSGVLRELVYAASDMGIEPIYKIVGDSVNYPMMLSSIDVARDEYFQTIVIPSIRKNELGDLDD